MGGGSGWWRAAMSSRGNETNSDCHFFTAHTHQFKCQKERKLQIEFLHIKNYYEPFQDSHRLLSNIALRFTKAMPLSQTQYLCK